MKNNIQAFLALVRAGLWEKDVWLLPYGQVDYDDIMRLAEEQSVVGLVTSGLERVNDIAISKIVLLQFIGATLQIEEHNKALNVFVADLVDIMRKVGIITLMVKGQGVALCYEKPQWRSCGDVDLFLSNENYEKAKAFLVPRASSVEKEYGREKHLGMTLGSWVVELHGRLYCGLSSRIDNELDRVYQDTFYCGNVRSWNVDNVRVFLLAAENDVFYVFTHILQHFYKGGIGLRQICDWCRLLWTFKDKLDLKLLESRIHNAGLMSEWKAFGAYIVEYLGMPSESVPFYSAAAKWKGKASRINKFVLSVGNMGHNRDLSFYGKYPFLVRKCISMWRRIGDLINHARIFPLDSLRFSYAIICNGIESVVKREG